MTYEERIRRVVKWLNENDLPTSNMEIKGIIAAFLGDDETIVLVQCSHATHNIVCEQGSPCGFTVEGWVRIVSDV